MDFRWGERQKQWQHTFKLGSVPGLMLQTLALEVAQKNITVNAICPGYVLTDLVRNQIKDTARIRGIPEASVISDVLLADQPTKQVRGRGA